MAQTATDLVNAALASRQPREELPSQRTAFRIQALEDAVRALAEHVDELERQRSGDGARG